MKRREQIVSLLKSESTLVLATADASGISRSTPLFYSCDDQGGADELCLHWFSAGTSGHSRDLKRSPEAAVAIYRPTADWKKICGVQMRGRVTTIADRARRKAITANYCERFQLGTIFRATISRSTLYAFRPSWIRYLDNGRRFGYKFEITVDDTR